MFRRGEKRGGIRTGCEGNGEQQHPALTAGHRGGRDGALMEQHRGENHRMRPPSVGPAPGLRTWAGGALWGGARVWGPAWGELVSLQLDSAGVQLTDITPGSLAEQCHSVRSWCGRCGPQRDGARS